MTTSLAPSSADDPLAYRPVALVDLLDRVLATGVVVSGDITLAIADVDLVRISLRALIASVGALAPPEPVTWSSAEVSGGGAALGAAASGAVLGPAGAGLGTGGVAETGGVVRPGDAEFGTGDPGFGTGDVVFGAGQ
ncbi:gas vesicle protein [Micromonospora musae]|uniref:gas vesicle protein n=1 Tax=Micromonospora musae TaxID=1894970 RepID=UPI0034280659